MLIGKHDWNVMRGGSMGVFRGGWISGIPGARIESQDKQYLTEFTHKACLVYLERM